VDCFMILFMVQQTCEPVEAGACNPIIYEVSKTSKGWLGAWDF